MGKSQGDEFCAMMTACGVDPKFPPLEEYNQSSYIPSNGYYNGYPSADVIAADYSASTAAAAAAAAAEGHGQSTGGGNSFEKFRAQYGMSAAEVDPVRYGGTAGMHHHPRQTQNNFYCYNTSPGGTTPTNSAAAAVATDTHRGWGYHRGVVTDSPWVNGAVDSAGNTCLFRQRNSGASKLHSRPLPPQQLPLYPWMKRIHVNPGMY